MNLILEKFAPSAPVQDVSQQYRFFWQPPRWNITDPTEHIVEGYASMCNLDDQGDVVPVEAIEAAMPSFMEWGALRAMHTKIAAGKVLAARVDGEGVWIKAKVTDGDSWQKVQDGVYQGFSIGGDVKEIATRPDGARMITRLQLNEISLVDRPANPRCKISVVKFVASTQQEELTRQQPVSAAVETPLTAAETPEPVEKKVGPGKVRPDTNPQQGVRDYGDVSFGDPANKKYPLDSEGHIRRGWSYINMPKNQKFYTPEAVAAIKRRIVSAWKKKIDPAGPPGAKDDPQLKKTSRKTTQKTLAMTAAELEEFKATLVDPDEIATIDKALGLVQEKSGNVEKSSTTGDNDTDSALFEPENVEKAAKDVPTGPWTDGSEENTDDKHEDEAQVNIDKDKIDDGIDRWDFLEGNVKGKREKTSRSEVEKAADDDDKKASKIKGKKKPGPTADEDKEDEDEQDGEDDDMEKGASAYHRRMGMSIAGALQACHKAAKNAGQDGPLVELLNSLNTHLKTAQRVHKSLRSWGGTEKAMGSDSALAKILARLEKVEDLVIEHEGNIETIAQRAANHEQYVDKILSQIPASRAVRTTVQPKDDLDDFPAAYRETAALRHRALGR
jgi:hypothetical protein